MLLKDWQYIIIHHSLSQDGKTHNWESIVKYHIHEKKWDDVGYHYGIEMVNDGTFDRIVIREGRPLHMVGAHTLTMNYKSLGICLIGDYDLVEPTELQYFYVAFLCNALMDLFYIPMYNVEPHHKYDAGKSCPGKMFNMDKLLWQITEMRNGRHGARIPLCETK